MTLLEAIQNCGENWFRPSNKTSWVGVAITIDGECTILAPDDIGEKVNFMISYIDDLLGEWEIVTPEQVMAERK